jgi:hypothetical protein
MLNNLIGIWKTDPEDIVTQRLYGNVIIEFRDNGELIYTISENGREQKIFMTFEVKGNTLITDQPSSPAKEITNFILKEQRLELNLDGVTSKYIKVGS